MEIATVNEFGGDPFTVHLGNADIQVPHAFAPAIANGMVQIENIQTVGIMSASKEPPHQRGIELVLDIDVGEPVMIPLLQIFGPGRRRHLRVPVQRYDGQFFHCFLHLLCGASPSPGMLTIRCLQQVYIDAHLS